MRVLLPSIGRLLLAATLLLPATTALAHEHWIDAGPARVEAGLELSILVGSGHDFPESLGALPDRVVDRLEVLPPAGEPFLLETLSGEKSRTGRLPVPAPGVYRLRLVLKQPKAAEPAFEAAALVVVGDADDPGRYGLGSGLELVPAAPIGALRVGAKLPVSLVRDGRPIQGRISILAEQGGIRHLSTESERPAEIRLPKPGRYLLTASDEGRGCSLVLRVEPAGP